MRLTDLKNNKKSLLSNETDIFYSFVLFFINLCLWRKQFLDLFCFCFCFVLDFVQQSEMKFVTDYSFRFFCNKYLWRVFIFIFLLISIYSFRCFILFTFTYREEIEIQKVVITFFWQVNIFSYFNVMSESFLGNVFNL